MEMHRRGCHEAIYGPDWKWLQSFDAVVPERAGALVLRHLAHSLAGYSASSVSTASLQDSGVLGIHKLDTLAIASEAGVHWIDNFCR
jgi:hypothetical protein